MCAYNKTTRADFWECLQMGIHLQKFEYSLRYCNKFQDSYLCRCQHVWFLNSSQYCTGIKVNTCTKIKKLWRANFDECYSCEYNNTTRADFWEWMPVEYKSIPLKYCTGFKIKSAGSFLDFDAKLEVCTFSKTESYMWTKRTTFVWKKSHMKRVLFVLYKQTFHVWNRSRFHYVQSRFHYVLCT